MRNKITIAEIAAEAGVSIPTVSKVLNQRGDVASKTRKRIEDVIAARNYVPNQAARALGGRRSGQIDLVVPALNSDYILEVVRGVEDALSDTQIRLTLSTTQDNSLREQKWLNRVTDASTDGTLLLLPREQSPHLAYLQQSEIPFVVIDDRGEISPDIPSVAATNWSGGLTATEYLLSLGHRRIAIICGSLTDISAKARLAGYRTALEGAGIPLDPTLVRPGNFQADSGYTQTCELLALEEPPTAIFACSDLQATGAYRALYTHGRVVPHDISVIGFDDVPFSKLMCPALTTIRQPLFEMGRTATSMLLRLIAGEVLDSKRVELTTQLIVRESCAT